MTYLAHRVVQGDTLESIASDFLGNADRWREIAVLNRLRYPFISDNPIDQYGQPIIGGVLTTAIAADVVAYAFQASELPVYASTYAKNCVFYIASGSLYDAMALASDVNESTGLLTFKSSISLSIQTAITAGSVVQTVTVTNLTGVKIGSHIDVDTGGNLETVAVVSVSSLDADSLTIDAVFTKSHSAGTLASYGFQNGYAIGTVFTLFSPVRDQRLRVLRTGDYVQLPSGSALSSVASTADALFVDLLGTDIYLGLDGQIAFGAIGDVTRVVGTKNLAQALRIRLNTPAHTYDRYPDYGNPLWDFLGQTTEPFFAAIVESMVRQAILADPRVAAVRSISITISGSTITVDAQIEILQSSQLLRLENLVVAVAR